MGQLGSEAVSGSPELRDAEAVYIGVGSLGLPLLFYKEKLLNPNIHTTWATGDEIRLIADKIQGALDGVTPEHALITMLSLIIVIQRPNISPEDLQMAVNEASTFVCLLLDGIGDVPEEQVGPPKLDLKLN